MRNWLGLGLAIAVAGCATHPNNIEPMFISTARYEGLDCDTLLREFRAADQAVAGQTARQEGRANNDALMAGVALFAWPALFAVGSHGNQAEELSQTMGERDALKRAALAKDCAEMVPPGAPAE